MSYQKFKADYLFDGYQLLDSNSVLITNEQGIVQEIIQQEDAGDDIQQFEGILSPGFINCHCHLELSHMRGLIPEKTGLVDFVFKVVTERHQSEEQILQAIAHAEAEMIDNGIVAVGDICNNTSTIHQKQKNNLHYYNFIEVSGWLPEIAETRFLKSSEFYNAFRQLPIANCQLSIAPHAPYSVSENLWQLLEPTFENKTTTIHNQETAFEDDLFLTKTGDFIRMYEMMKLDNSFFMPTGKSSLQSVFHHFKKAKNTLLVHNTFIKEADISFVNSFNQNNSQQFFYCLCVRANNYIEHANPPVGRLFPSTNNIVIGTDSLASNWSLSILDELKTVRQNFPFVPTLNLLQWATINGARALNMQQQLGSFEKGKQPGIVNIRHTENGNISQRSIAQTVKKVI